MNYLQQYLDKIEAEAAEQSRFACANAALIERAGKTLAKINAAANTDIAFATYHIGANRFGPASVTIQGRDQAEFIAALESAGYHLHQMPVEVRKSSFDEIIVELVIEPGIEVLLRGETASGLAAAALLAAETLPCAA